MLDDTPASAATCRIADLHELNREIVRVFLQPLTPPVLRFRAGQYINLVLPDGARRPFSLAGAPRGDHRLELHIRDPGGGLSGWLARCRGQGTALAVEGPLGDFHLSDSGRPLIMVAGGTGFAPIKALIEEGLQRRSTRRLHLYWGARRRADLYLEGLARQWAAGHDHIGFIPVLSQAPGGSGFRTGLVHEAVLEDFPDLSGYEVYACGPEAMIRALQPPFLRHGLARDRLFSDLFAFMAD